MPEFYHIRLDQPRLVFSAAHFITFNGDVCERLHGHNYHVSVEVHGQLDENHYVVDFIALRTAVQEIVDELDHRMLLPTEHPTIRVAEAVSEMEGESDVIVVHDRRRWVFPRGDCALLPVANTTAELLARYILDRLRPSLDEWAVERASVAVDECDGQWGVCEIALGD